MKICVLLMISSLLVSLVPSTYGLKCFACDSVCSGIGELKNCSSDDKFCQVIFITSKLKNVHNYLNFKKFVVSTGSTDLVVKGCNSECFEMNESKNGKKVARYCCNTDGCNFGVLIKSSILFIFFSIVGTFLRKLI